MKSILVSFQDKITILLLDRTIRKSQQIIFRFQIKQTGRKRKTGKRKTVNIIRSDMLINLQSAPYRFSEIKFFTVVCYEMFNFVYL